MDPARFAAEVRAVRPAAVGLYHQYFAEWGGHGRHTQLSVAALPPHRLAVCGDIHVRGLAAPATGPAAALSPGPLAPQSVAEFDLTPAVWAVHADLTVTAVPLKGRRYCRVEVGTPEAAEAALALVAGLGPDPDLPDRVSRPVVAVKVCAPLVGFAEALTGLAARRDVLVRLSFAGSPADPTHSLDRPGPAGPAHPPPPADLVRVAAGWAAADAAARDLAAALVAPGADPAAVLAAARASHEADLAAEDYAGDADPDDAA